MVDTSHIEPSQAVVNFEIDADVQKGIVDENIIDRNEDDNVNEELKKTKKKKNKKKKKANPLRPISVAFPENIFPEGQFIISNKMHNESNENADKIGGDDKHFERLNYLRQAAEVHRRVRMHMAPKLKVGTDLSEFCKELEDNVYKVVQEDGIKANMAFPTGVNVNECAAHYTPDIDEVKIVEENDIIKVDFGVHVNGHLVDSAFTVNLNPTIENLKQATIDATNAGLKLSGPDAYISDITDAIFETITSFEVQEKNGNMVQVDCINNLNGHQIEPYIIHAGKNIPLINGGHGGKLGRMLIGEQFAIETFASINGNGNVKNRGPSTHFMIAPHMLNHRHKMESVNNLLKTIRQNHHTLAFCQRFLARKMQDFPKSKMNWSLNALTSQGIINDYPPLCDRIGSMTSQMEHTLFIRENGAEIITRGEDY